MTATQQKQEAENFLKRVQSEYKYLTVLGYQAVINASVEEMKALGVFSDNLTEATFLAGLRYSIDSGILPKPPAPGTSPEEIAAKEEQRAAQEEAQRLAKEEQRRTALWNKQQFGSRKHNHALDVDPNEPKENISAREEKQAEARCGLIRGRSHAETDQLRKLFVMKESDRTQIDWRATEQKRLQMARKGDLVKHTNPRY